MKRSVLSILLLTTCLFGSRAGEIKYPSDDIPPQLLKNADAVIRTCETVFEVRSMNNARLSVHKVITILRENASDLALLRLYYDELSSVGTFKGFLYDSGGHLVKEFRNRDITDESAVEDGSLYSGDRVMMISPASVTYPFTVEYFTELNYKKILYYPNWMPCNDYRVSIQSSKFDVVSADGLFPRIYKKNLPSDVISEKSLSGSGESWEIRDFKAIGYEPLSPGFKNIAPLIMTEAARFMSGGFEGDFSTWKGVGVWLYSLIKGRDTLDATYTEPLLSLVNNEPDTLRKIKIIYRHLQQSTRYVNVNIGIGGWRPENANTIARLGYGDCKGLVNYMKALLAAFGIRSVYTVIHAGDFIGEIVTDFPGNQFNHVILAVPVSNDTIWLECTNQFKPFGYLGAFTCNRYALLVTPGGGVLVRTPAYSRENNLKLTILDIDIDSSGKAAIKRWVAYRGLEYDDVDGLLTLTPDRLKETVLKDLNMPGMNLESVSMSSSGDRLPVAVEQIVASVRDYASRSGSRMFVPLNSFIEKPGMLKKDTARKSDLVLLSPLIETDTILISIPFGYFTESVPKSVRLATRFGTLHMESSVTGDKIRVLRRLEIEEGRYPASAYNEFVTFLQQINRLDKSRIVLKH